MTEADQLRQIADELPAVKAYALRSSAMRLEALEAALRQAREALKWYVAEDDVLEGEHWEEENAFWIAGKRDAESSIAAINDLLKASTSAAP